MIFVMEFVSSKTCFNEICNSVPSNLSELLFILSLSCLFYYFDLKVSFTLTVLCLYKRKAKFTHAFLIGN